MPLLAMLNDNGVSDLYNEVCSFENIELAFRKARRGKSLKPYVVKFEEELDCNVNYCWLKPTALRFSWQSR